MNLLQWQHLPPVGEPVVMRAGGPAPLADWPDQVVRWVDSGTSALGLALSAAWSRRPVPRPEVILPGYACPDLVAACEWARVTPVLVDLAAESPWLDERALRAACNANTVAIVAVNFLGVRERLPMLRAVAERAGCALVEDCAQWFPTRGAELPADYTILSFGKGKPVPLLGGGAVLARDGRGLPSFPPVQGGSGFSHECFRAKASMKALAYNAILHPLLYGALLRVPGLGIGDTRFDPLEAVAGMDAYRLRWLPASVAAYQRRPQPAAEALRQRLVPLVARGLKDFTASQPEARLLRYPLLLPTREQALLAEQALNQRGLGASRMYRAPLPAIEGVPVERLTIPAPLVNAADVAGRLLTLPVHSRVTPRHVEAMVAVLAAVLGSLCPPS